MFKSVVQYLIANARRAVDFCVMYLSAMRSFLRVRSSYIQQVVDGDTELLGRGKVAIFAHFDPAGRVHRFVIHQLEELRGLGFQIVFVTNSPKLLDSSLDELRPLVAKILLRKNVGYDFGAYKDGIQSLGDLSSYDNLLLMNDSVYGPFRSLAQIFEEDDAEEFDFLAMTDSWEVRYHLQSYFLWFNHSVLCNKEFAQFWSGLRYVDNKNYVVRRYEVGLTQLLLHQRLRGRALFPYDEATRLAFEEVVDISANIKEFRALTSRNQDFYSFLRHSIEMGVPMNASHFLWSILLKDMRCPFVKRELLSKNPMRVPGLIALDELINEQGDYDVTMIRDHLKLINRGRAG